MRLDGEESRIAALDWVWMVQFALEPHLSWWIFMRREVSGSYAKHLILSGPHYSSLGHTNCLAITEWQVERVAYDTWC